jgi:hypothetical protein
MNRRQMIAALSGAAAWPLAARAQQATKTPRIGILSPGRSENPILKMINAFLKECANLVTLKARTSP